MLSAAAQLPGIGERIDARTCNLPTKAASLVSPLRHHQPPERAYMLLGVVRISAGRANRVPELAQRDPRCTRQAGHPHSRRSQSQCLALRQGTPAYYVWVALYSSITPGIIVS
jgi:hypothetical protein